MKISLLGEQERLESHSAPTANRPEHLKRSTEKVHGDSIKHAHHAMNRAHDAKVEATHKWVMGEMSSKKHKEIHSRANHVLKNKGHV